jgi:DNA repair protein RecN (Recombination protein N)
VQKESTGGRTRTRLEAVEGDERIDEIARMAGGEHISEATRAHARALVEAAHVRGA